MKTPLGWDWVTEPTLMLDSAVAKSNIHRMAEKARRLGVRWRPHFKTHQSAEIGEWFRAEGVEGITVSSVQMATYFADAGWNDIVIAFPVNIRAIAAINDLAARVRLGLLVSDPSVLPMLADGLHSTADAWIEIDSGDGRSGFDWDDADGIARTAYTITKIPNLRFAGLLGHGGFTYKSRNTEEIREAHADDIDKLRDAKESLESRGFQNFLVSTGDTPACSQADDYGGADEIRPGNLVFYDIQQQHIGSCGYEHIAVAMACPVVAVYPERSEVILHGGGVHFGKDALLDAAYGSIYGRIALPKDNGWEMPEMGCYLRSISQEHGIAVLRKDLIAKIVVGDLLAVLPVHSCMTADLMERLHAVDRIDPRRPIPMMKAQHK